MQLGVANRPRPITKAALKLYEVQAGLEFAPPAQHRPISYCVALKVRDQ